MEDDSGYKNTIQIIKKVIKILLKFNSCYLLFSILNMIIQGLLPSIMLVLLQRIINILQNQNYGLDYVLMIGGVYLLCGLFSECLVYFYTYHTNIVSQEFDKKINLEMMIKASNLKQMDFEKHQTYDVINRAQGQNGASLLSFISQCLEVIRSCVTILSMFVLLVQYRWWMGIIIFLIPVVRCVFTIMYRRRSKMDNNSLSHVRWKCQYHIIFIPKYRKRVLYGKLNADVRDIISALCRYKGVEIIDGAVCEDHIHLCVANPPKYSIQSLWGT